MPELLSIAAREDRGGRYAGSNSLLPTFDLDAYRDKNYLTHNLHPYPAKFIPQIPRLLIEKLSPEGGTIFDPFCGCGTALLEAALMGRRAIGVDLNPLAVLISRVKTTRLSVQEFRQLRSFLSRFSQEFLNGKPSLGHFPVPEFKNRTKWFTPEALAELAAIKARIEQVRTPVVRDVLLACFSAIIVKASNQESDTRWKAVNKGRKRGDSLRFFAEKVETVIGRLRELADLLPSAHVRVQQTNAKDVSFIKGSSVDLVVTSPPYMNSFDYYLYHKLRMFWLGFDHYAVQEQEIGSRNKHCDDGLGLGDYLSEMEATMKEMRRVLKNGAFAAFVIGDSILRAKLVEMDRGYKSIANKTGLRFVDQFSYDQRRYTKAFTENYKTLTKQTHILLFRAA